MSERMENMGYQTKSSRRASEDFISRGVRTVTKAPAPQAEPEEDLETPAFMRKKLG